MSLLVNLILISTLYLTSRADSTRPLTPAPPMHNGTKIKRTITELHSLGETKPVLVLVDNVASASSNIPTFYAQPKPLILKPVFDASIPKQVAAQQVLYEFEQTPTNAVSNVHVNQLFQPLDFHKHPPTTTTLTTEASVSRHPYARGLASPSHHIIQTSESIANPVQHSALINHGQNYAQILTPSTLATVGSPQHIQTQHYIPGKYLYVNGKILYQPTPLVAHSSSPGSSSTNSNNHGYGTVQATYHPLNNYQHNAQPGQVQYHGYNNQNSLTNTAPQTYGHNHNQNNFYAQNYQRRPVTFAAYSTNPPGNNNNINNNNNNAKFPKQNLTPPSKSPVVGYSKFQPPTQLQPITKPMSSSQPSEEDDESVDEERSPIKQDEEEAEETEDDEHDDGERGSYSKYEEEEKDPYEESPGKYYDKYAFEEEDPEHEHYHQEEEEVEDDDDSHRGATKVVTTKAAKHPVKHPKKKSKPIRPAKINKSNKYKYREGYSTRTEYERPPKRISKKGKPPLKYKTVKYTRPPGGKPRIETIEGRQSQIIPVVEKRKVFQESWVVKTTEPSS